MSSSLCHAETVCLLSKRKPISYLEEEIPDCGCIVNHFWIRKELKKMRFNKNLPQENREFLAEQLKKYEKKRQ